MSGVSLDITANYEKAKKESKEFFGELKKLGQTSVGTALKAGAFFGARGMVRGGASAIGGELGQLKQASFDELKNIALNETLRAAGTLGTFKAIQATVQSRQQAIDAFGAMGPNVSAGAFNKAFNAFNQVNQLKAQTAAAGEAAMGGVEGASTRQLAKLIPGGEATLDAAIALKKSAKLLADAAGALSGLSGGAK